MDTSERSATTEVPAQLAAPLAELEAYLEGEPPERLAELVLPFATTWILADVGFDLERYRREARLFIDATPMWDRILEQFPDRVTYWLSQRLMLDEHDQPHDEQAQARLAAARALLGERAALLDPGFPRVAAGFRALLDASAGGSPPADRLWMALARRIGERELAQDR